METTDEQERTPLYGSSEEVVKIFLANGANVKMLMHVMEIKKYRRDPNFC